MSKRAFAAWAFRAWEFGSWLLRGNVDESVPEITTNRTAVCAHGPSLRAITTAVPAMLPQLCLGSVTTAVDSLGSNVLPAAVVGPNRAAMPAKGE